jgi:hypothetical protein
LVHSSTPNPPQSPNPPLKLETEPGERGQKGIRARLNGRRIALYLAGAL